jgi:hypothetical protein
VQERLDQAVSRVREQLLAAWPTLVDTTRWSWSERAVRVEGGVLVASQARRYVELLGAELEPLPVPTPAVLSALDGDFAGHRWLTIVGEAAIDLYRLPTGLDLQTQWTPPATLRRFAARDRRLLVQLPDATLGWVDEQRLEPVQPATDPWSAVLRPTAGSPVGPADDLPSPLVDVAERGRARLGRPYLWGGNTDAAADCSGLVQSLLLEASGVLLPKHTGDQRRLGARVAGGAIAPGDLVFVRGRDKGIAHVGLALPSADGTTVLHSCLSRGRVLEEPLAEFLARYRFTGARRVVDWGAP